MKTEDLQKQGLTQEQINFVMAENGKGLKALQTENAALVAERDTWKDRAETAEKTLKGFEGKDFDEITRERDEWKRKHDEAIETHKKEQEDREFNSHLDAAISKAKGKNTKAIRALLDIDSLRASRNLEQDIGSALDAMREENGWLFEDNGGAPYFVDPNGNGGSGTASKITKDAFSKMSYKDRLKIFHENQELYKKLMS